MTQPIGEKILKEIEERKIEPKSRFQFVLAQYVLWVVSGIAVCVGGLSVAVMLFMFSEHEWDLLSSSELPLQRILAMLPFLWIVILAGLVMIALYNISHTKRGYKHHALTLVLASVVASALFGILLYLTGVGETLERVFEERIPVYAEWFAPQHRLWNHPEEGRLGGRISQVITEDHFIMQTIGGDEWLITVTSYTVIQPEDTNIEPNAHIVIVGEETDEYQFTADVIRFKDRDIPFGDPLKKPKPHSRPNHFLRPQLNNESEVK